LALLALLRHGPTAWTAERRLQGRTDIPLSPEGKATVLGWHLPKEAGGCAWVTSPLRRARETAALLGHAGAPADGRLAELGFGVWEGRRLADLRAELGPTMAVLEDRGLDFRAPGGESPRELQRRLAPFLAETGLGRSDVIAVTHRSVIRAIYAQATGWPMLGRPPDRLAEFALHQFAIDSAGRPAVHRLNLPLSAPAGEAAFKGAAGRGAG
jgi:probable phosphoglycerate mutase